MRLLTYGELLLAALLETVAAPATGESTAVVRMAWEGDPPLRGYYRLAADRFAWLDSLATVEQAFDDSAAARSPEMAEAAQRDFARRCVAALKRWEEHVERLQSLLHSQLAARGRRLLVEIALGRRQEPSEATHPISFGPEWWPGCDGMAILSRH